MKKWAVFVVLGGGVLLLFAYEYKWRLPFSYWVSTQVDKVLRYVLP